MVAILALAGSLIVAAGPAGPAHAQVTPVITIEPHQSKVTGHIDWINYTLTRNGATTNALDATVTLTPPTGNDWTIPTRDSLNKSVALWHSMVAAAGAGRSEN